MKRIICLLLASLLLLGAVPTAFAANTEAGAQGLTVLKVNPYGGEEAAIDTVKWEKVGDGLFLFLPADVSLDRAKVYFDASDKVTLDGALLSSGGSAAGFTAGAHTLACGGEEYALTVCFSANLPAVYITTASGSLDYIHKSTNNKEPGNIRVYENGSMTLDSALKQMKGRGNSTWNLAKKPYNIKFDKKTAFLGMAKAKKWTLLANAYDPSLMHNANGFYFAEAFGLDFTSEYRFIDLYVNGGYLGNYMVCESVEVGENRVNVEDLDKANENANPGVDLETLPIRGTGADGKVEPVTVKGSRKWADIPNDPADITGGYLLEYEFASRYTGDPCGFVTDNGQPVVLKSPEYASRAEVDYIADLLNAATEALYSETGCNRAGKHYSEYFDMESFVNMYLLQELSMNYDAGCSSFYLYKKAGDPKLTFSPVWDMDLAFGINMKRNQIYANDVSVWWANMMGFSAIPTILAAAYRHAAFREAVDARWKELRAAGVFEENEQRMTALSVTLHDSAIMNMLRWKQDGVTAADSADRYWTYRVSACTKFVKNRTASLDTAFGEDRACVYYDPNGGVAEVWTFMTKIMRQGERTAAADIADTKDMKGPGDLVFAGWNTRRDGTGVSFLPGDALLPAQEYTVLYAVWNRDGRLPAHSLGDIDGDARVTAADARLALRASVELESYEKGSAVYRAADVNRDGEIRADDARAILRAAVELENLPLN